MGTRFRAGMNGVGQRGTGGLPRDQSHRRYLYDRIGRVPHHFIGCTKTILRGSGCILPGRAPFSGQGHPSTWAKRDKLPTGFCQETLVYCHLLYHLQQVTAGPEVEALLVLDHPLVKEAWIRGRGWYHDAEDCLPPPIKIHHITNYCR